MGIVFSFTKISQKLQNYILNKFTSITLCAFLFFQKILSKTIFQNAKQKTTKNDHFQKSFWLISFDRKKCEDFLIVSF